MTVSEDFTGLTGRFRGELLAHCYRMLGSAADAEDLVQETYLRAWRAYEGVEGRSSVRTWLYPIATNACLTAIQRRGRPPLPSGLGGATRGPRGPGGAGGRRARRGPPPPPAPGEGAGRAAAGGCRAGDAAAADLVRRPGGRDALPRRGAGVRRAGAAQARSGQGQRAAGVRGLPARTRRDVPRLRGDGANGHRDRDRAHRHLLRSGIVRPVRPARGDSGGSGWSVVRGRRTGGENPSTPEKT